jgi:hypothetical protein
MRNTTGLTLPSWMQLSLGILIFTLSMGSSCRSTRASYADKFTEQDAQIMRNENQKYRPCEHEFDKQSCFDEKTGAYRIAPRPF